METLTLDRHLRSALLLLKSSRFVFYWLAFISIWNTSSTLIEGRETGPLGIMAFILSLTTTPVIYGILYQRVIGTDTSLGAVIKTYIPGYFWLLVKMYIPAMLVAAMPMMLSPQTAGEGHFFVILITFSVIYLFVIPYFYLSGRQDGAILSGVSFLARHFSSCTPILLTVVLLEALMLVAELAQPTLLKLGPALFSFIDISAFLIASVIDYILFVLLVMILRSNDQCNEI